MIPDEAVEAAAEAIFESRGRNKWGDASEFWSGAKESTRKEARAALEAALPFLAGAAQHQRRSPTDWPDIPKAQP